MKLGDLGFFTTKGRSVGNHVTVEELAVASALDEQTVLRICLERSIPIYRGRVDRSLFAAELKQDPSLSSS